MEHFICMISLLNSIYYVIGMLADNTGKYDDLFYMYNITVKFCILCYRHVGWQHWELRWLFLMYNITVNFGILCYWYVGWQHWELRWVVLYGWSNDISSGNSLSSLVMSKTSYNYWNSNRVDEDVVECTHL